MAHFCCKQAKIFTVVCLLVCASTHSCRSVSMGVKGQIMEAAFFLHVVSGQSN